MRLPSISTKSELCPSHVTRSPVAGSVDHAGTGFSTGSGDDGVLFFPPKKNSRINANEFPVIPGLKGYVL
jgi:hypothetical protein